MKTILTVLQAGRKQCGKRRNCSLQRTKDNYIALENIVRKGEIACNKQFLLFSLCFLLYMALIFHFKCTLKCPVQFVSIWTSLKFCHLVIS